MTESHLTSVIHHVIEGPRQTKAESIRHRSPHIAGDTGLGDGNHETPEYSYTANSDQKPVYGEQRAYNDEYPGNAGEPSTNSHSDGTYALSAIDRLRLDDFAYSYMQPNHRPQIDPTEYLERIFDEGNTSRVSKPQSLVPETRHIRGGMSNNSDKNYRVRKRQFYEIERIFCVLGTELNEPPAKEDASFISLGRCIEGVFIPIKRFVVVERGEGHCLCLPVTSYAGAGRRREGINLAEHGALYRERSPMRVDGIIIKPAKVRLSEGATVPDRCLVNYGKHYVVEMNVQAKDVGKIEPSFTKVLLHYFKKLWAAKSDVDSGSPETEIGITGVAESKPSAIVDWAYDDDYNYESAIVDDRQFNYPISSTTSEHLLYGGQNTPIGTFNAYVDHAQEDDYPGTRTDPSASGHARTASRDTKSIPRDDVGIQYAISYVRDDYDAAPKPTSLYAPSQYHQVTESAISSDRILTSPLKGTYGNKEAPPVSTTSNARGYIQKPEENEGCAHLRIRGEIPKKLTPSMSRSLKGCHSACH